MKISTNLLLAVIILLLQVGLIYTSNHDAQGKPGINLKNITTEECHRIVAKSLKGRKHEAFLQDACNLCGIDQIECNCKSQYDLCFDVTVFNNALHQTLDKECQQRITRAVLNFLFGVIGLFGNLMVVIVTIKFQKKLSRCHILIGGLAMSDLIFSISQMIRYLPTFWTCQWKLGEDLCVGFPLIKDLSSYLGVGFILIIATERYMLIVHPYRKPLSNSFILLLCVGNIFLGIAVTIPKVLKMHLNKFTNRCHSEWESKDAHLVYEYVMFAFYFALPIITMSYEHAQIVNHLSQQGSNIRKNVQQEKKAWKRNKRITKILVCILIAYLFLVFPTRLVCIIRAHIQNVIVRSDSLNTALRLFSCIPYGFHVAINPLIYSFVDRKFRKYVKSLLPCCFQDVASSVLSSTTSSSA